MNKFFLMLGLLFLVVGCESYEDHKINKDVDNSALLYPPCLKK